MWNHPREKEPRYDISALTDVLRNWQNTWVAILQSRSQRCNSDVFALQCSLFADVFGLQIRCFRRLSVELTCLLGMCQECSPLVVVLMLKRQSNQRENWLEVCLSCWFVKRLLVVTSFLFLSTHTRSTHRNVTIQVAIVRPMYRNIAIQVVISLYKMCCNIPI